MSECVVRQLGVGDEALAYSRIECRKCECGVRLDDYLAALRARLAAAERDLAAARAKEKNIRCAFCDFAVSEDEPDAADQLRRHLNRCSAHPLKRELDAANEYCERVMDQRDAARRWALAWKKCAKALRAE